jgi:signal transduction histidine kinase
MKQNAQTVTVSVQDNGIGMTEEVRAHIFEKFFQGDPSREKKGYGIGLAIVSRILQLCNGTITVQSEKNQGSTFSVTLPRKN